MKKTEKENLESRELEMTSTEAGEALQAGGEEVAGPVGEKNGSGEESFDSEKNTETPSEPSDQPKKKSIDLKGSLNTKNVRYGSYSAALSAIVIVIAVVVNLIASVLPSGPPPPATTRRSFRNRGGSPKRPPYRASGGCGSLRGAGSSCRRRSCWRRGSAGTAGAAARKRGSRGP